MLLLVYVVPACVTNPTPRLGTTNERFDDAEARLAGHQQAYAAVARDVEAMRALARELTDRVELARRDLDAAVRDYERARVLYGSASAEYAGAAKSWYDAAQAFQLSATILVIAATADLFLSDVCGPSVSTRQFRQMMRDAGHDPEGFDADHLISRAHGGPDRVWNYQLLEPSINRSLGAGGLFWKLMHMPIPTLTALAKTASFRLFCNGP